MARTDKTHATDALTFYFCLIYLLYVFSYINTVAISGACHTVFRSDFKGQPGAVRTGIRDVLC